MESLSQALGRAVMAAGFDGLLAPSTVDPLGINLVVFLKAHGDAAKIRLLNPGALTALGKN